MKYREKWRLRKTLSENQWAAGQFQEAWYSSNLNAWYEET